MIQMKFSPMIINRIINIFLILLFITGLTLIDEKLSAFLHHYKTIFILIYLVSLTLIIYEVSKQIYDSQKSKNSQKKLERDFKNLLNNFNVDEKYILSLFVDKQLTALALDPKNPTIQILETKKILINTSKIEGNKNVFQIHPHIYQSLRNNPNILY